MNDTMDDTFRPPRTRAGRRCRSRLVISGAVVAVVLLVVAGLTVFELARICGPLGSGVYRVDGECVGVTDGSYEFDRRFEDVQKQIETENRRVREAGEKWSASHGDEGRPYVTVALLDPMTGFGTSGMPWQMVRNRLRGAFIAQFRANRTNDLGGDRHPQIQLVLANHGSGSQWPRVVEQLVEMAEQDNTGQGNLVAVIGLGVSTEQTRKRIQALSGAGIPTVGAVLTADTLNNVSAPGFVKTSPSNEHYVAALHEYVKAYGGFEKAIPVHDSNSATRDDLFTKSLQEQFDKQMGDLIEYGPTYFAGKTGSTRTGYTLFDPVTRDICSVSADTVLFAGREIDLSGLLENLQDRKCGDVPMTVLTAGSDLGAILEEWDETGKLAKANLTVVFAGTVDAEGWSQGADEWVNEGSRPRALPGGYAHFKDAFQAHGFALEDLADAGAVMTHDALAVATSATRLATSESRIPTYEDVVGQLMNLRGQEHVPAASGTLSFSPENNGNPSGKLVPVFRYPRDPSGKLSAPWSRSRQVLLPGKKTYRTP